MGLPERVAIVGARGRMGRRLDALAEEHGFEVGARVDRDSPSLEAVGADTRLVIDFSTAEQAPRTLEFAVGRGLPCVLGTTGLGEEGARALRDAVARIPVVFAPNFSVGVTLLTHLVAEVARGLPSVWELEIIETHHRAKVDAPSGTALALAEAAASARGWPLGEVLRGGRSGACGPRGEREIGVHAVRGGSVVGDHETRFLGVGETLTLSHRALDRDIFARGAWRAARFLLGLDGGPRPCAGVYDMNDVLGLR